MLLNRSHTNRLATNSHLAQSKVFTLSPPFKKRFADQMKPTRPTTPMPTMPIRPVPSAPVQYIEVYDYVHLHHKQIRFHQLGLRDDGKCRFLSYEPFPVLDSEWHGKWHREHRNLEVFVQYAGREDRVRHIFFPAYDNPSAIKVGHVDGKLWCAITKVADCWIGPDSQVIDYRPSKL